MTTYSLTGFAAFATHMAVELDKTKREALEHAAVIVEKEAKRVIGTYDYGWQSLADSTLARKTNGDKPLLETGEMRESITHNSDQHEAMIGSDNDKAFWHELGTSKVHPRPFLVGAAQTKEHEVVKEIGERMHARLTSSKP